MTCWLCLGDAYECDCGKPKAPPWAGKGWSRLPGFVGEDGVILRYITSQRLPEPNKDDCSMWPSTACTKYGHWPDGWVCDAGQKESARQAAIFSTRRGGA